MLFEDTNDKMRMSGDEIEHFFRKTPMYKYLKGIVSIDMISDIENLELCNFLVFNESKRDSKGAFILLCQMISVECPINFEIQIQQSKIKVSFKVHIGSVFTETYLEIMQVKNFYLFSKFC